MPAYNAAFTPAGILPGDKVVLFNAETLTPPAASMAVNVSPTAMSSGAPAFSVNLHFASAPTSFTFNVQGANDDVAGEYVTVGTIATGTATDYQLSLQTNAPYLRANLAAQSGGGAVTVEIVRVS